MPQLWFRFDPWSGNFHMLQVHPKKEKREKRSQEGWVGPSLDLAGVVQNMRSSFLPGKYTERQRETQQNWPTP